MLVLLQNPNVHIGDALGLGVIEMVADGVDEMLGVDVTLDV